MMTPILAYHSLPLRDETPADCFILNLDAVRQIWPKPEKSGDLSLYLLIYTTGNSETVWMNPDHLTSMLELPIDDEPVPPESTEEPCFPSSPTRE